MLAMKICRGNWTEVSKRPCMGCMPCNAGVLALTVLHAHMYMCGTEAFHGYTVYTWKTVEHKSCVGNSPKKAEAKKIDE